MNSLIKELLKLIVFVLFIVWMGYMAWRGIEIMADSYDKSNHETYKVWIKVYGHENITYSEWEKLKQEGLLPEQKRSNIEEN